MDQVIEQINRSRKQKDFSADKRELLLNLVRVRGENSRRLMWATVVVLPFFLYIYGISQNSPGFYVDEAGLAYNAYLVAQTGAGEFGSGFPLYFQFYTGNFTQYANPTCIYLLAFVFWIFGPSILLTRLLAAMSMYAASLLLGILAARLSGRRAIGFIIALTALLTPWLFEVGRLMLETFFYPMAVVLFLWAVYRAQNKREWRWSDCLTVGFALTLLTYSYTIGRLLAPLLALGLLCFAANKQRLFAIGKTWLVYGITLVPLMVFIWRNPGLTTRFSLLSYVKPESTTREIILKFVSRYLEDINPVTPLFYGDINQRHHMPDALGSLFFATFILAVIGVIVVLVRHRGDAWWRFVLYGLAVSVVPAALTVDKFHTLRMIAYPVFLLMLTVPALQWLLERPKMAQTKNKPVRKKPIRAKTPPSNHTAGQLRRGILAFLLIVTTAEASYFHWQFYQEGSKRGYIFDAAYKQLYDAAVAQPNRPIYLVDGYWGPAYMHSFWYATLEGRSTGEFIHQPYEVRPPAGVIVISSEQNCTGCEIINRSGDYMLYKATN